MSHNFFPSHQKQSQMSDWNEKMCVALRFSTHNIQSVTQLLLVPHHNFSLQLIIVRVLENLTCHIKCYFQSLQMIYVTSPCYCYNTSKCQTVTASRVLPREKFNIEIIYIYEFSSTLEQLCNMIFIF